ncbi:carbonic anhydrase [Bifidobacterium psychraerophilum]|jgi:carbonic anhydrase|uniref:carbonic anhydrase n=1 Tax=Bifidobacterium psychraerophilum TaxID=218140 RepID=A0A087CHR4_9BIFI|nr:carbonic anhydrase [Bifidobacterium psychraerophilum]KFI82814.1 carbonic anhydrase [Bifidobacterium psychraerophilum]MCI1659534.1 carbonic anhydrase [Bifidobacterium psychraerophilum]MCI1804498.1 carbonic anhydrase [Bifidobacterium psychraerophilum]MCI2176346.1 carbonic anhydrase [Bifidobacterium psychraerophilum]MCI2181180.1 carbonic anhydrase [Bifidobacterium psychraerophilum]
MQQEDKATALERPDGDLATSTWSRMLAGNRRFSQGEAEHPWQDAETREQLIDGQHPFATVLSCSDSRVPPEIVFDQGLGDLFTIRTAGEILDEAVVASLEFSVQALHVNLIVVMGHEHCGAVQSALKGLSLGKAEDSDSIVVRQVGASIQTARESELDSSDDYERVHVARTIENLVERSTVLREAVASGQIMIVGSRYLLTTGKVEVLSF